MQIDRLNDIEKDSIEYYADGDGTDNYSHCFEEDVARIPYEPDMASQWLRAALNNDYNDLSHGTSPEVAVYQRWIDNQDMDELAEPELSHNEYWVSRDTLTAYALPEYDTVTQDIDFNVYPRLTKAISDHSANVDVYDNNLVVWLSGNIVYKPTAKHQRAARLIQHLYGDL